MLPEIRVRGYHTDLYQHVNNSRYVEFLEEGRWQVLDDYLKTSPFFQGKYFFMVVNLNISYKKQAFIDDILVVKTGIIRIGNKSGVLRQEIVNKNTGDIVVEADATFVFADKTGKAVKFEGEVLDIVTAIPEFSCV